MVADFLVENDLATAPDQTVALFGGSFRLSTPEVALGAAVLGALSVLLVILGVGPAIADDSRRADFTLVKTRRSPSRPKANANRTTRSTIRVG